jgi:hypothetical protein
VLPQHRDAAEAASAVEVEVAVEESMAPAAVSTGNVIKMSRLV